MFILEHRNVAYTVCAEMFAGLNFHGFRGLLRHPRKLNLRIIVVLIIKWPTRRAVHVNVAKHDYDRTKGAIGFVLVQIKLRLKCFYSS